MPCYCLIMSILVYLVMKLSQLRMTFSVLKMMLGYLSSVVVAAALYKLNATTKATKVKIYGMSDAQSSLQNPAKTTPDPPSSSRPPTFPFSSSVLPSTSETHRHSSERTCQTKSRDRNLG